MASTAGAGTTLPAGATRMPSDARQTRTRTAVVVPSRAGAGAGGRADGDGRGTDGGAGRLISLVRPASSELSIACVGHASISSATEGVRELTPLAP